MITTLGTAVLALVVARATPVPSTPAPSASAPSALVSAPPDTDGGVRRGPETAPRMSAPTDPSSVTIRNSGSTNTAGFTIIVHADRSADVLVGGQSERKTVGAPQTRWLFHKVREAGPLDALAGGGCMKSASFGSTMTIAFDGRTSPDLSCGGDEKSRELNRIANVIATELAVGGPRMRGRPIL